MTAASSSAPDLRQVASLLVIKPSSLGDIVHTLPAVHLIKQAHPHLHIRWISNPEWIPLLEGNADLDEVIPFPRREFRGLDGFVKFLLWARRLNREERQFPEVALDFQGLLRSGLIARMRGSERVIGLSDSREGARYFHDHVVTVNSFAHAVDRNLEMPRFFGIEAPTDELKFPLPAGSAPEGFTIPDHFLLIHPYSRGEGKSLSHENLQALCDCLAPRPVLIVGRQSPTQEIMGRHVISAVNKTSLSELLWLIHHATACLSVDSGPMHMAAAAGKPTLGIHTWSDPRKVGPYQDQAVVWKAGRIAHRNDFTDLDAGQNQPIEAPNIRRMADFLLTHA